MKTSRIYKCMSLAGVAAIGLFAAQAFATPVACPAGEQGSPVCISTTGSPLDGSNTSLADLLGPGGSSTSIFSSGPGINPYTDQHSPSSYWAINATGGSENTVILTLSSNTPHTTFGIFDPTETNNRLALFGAGANTQGYSTTLKTNGVGGFAATYFGSNPLDPSTGHATATFNDGALFGYYLDVNGTTYYSNATLNANGLARMATYEGDGKSTLALNGLQFSSGEFLLAWEDGTDMDYQDFVVMVESVHAVPEPAVLGMFGLGVLMIGGFVALRRRDSSDRA